MRKEEEGKRKRARDRIEKEGGKKKKVEGKTVRWE
jgi:hypothetical protein